MSSFVNSAYSEMVVGDWTPYLDNPLVGLNEGVGVVYFAFRFPWAVPIYSSFAENVEPFEFFTLHIGVCMGSGKLQMVTYSFSKSEVLDILGDKKRVDLNDRVLVENIRKNSISNLVIDRAAIGIPKNDLAEMFTTLDLSGDTSMLMVGICYVNKDFFLQTNTAAVRREAYNRSAI